MRVLNKKYWPYRFDILPNFANDENLAEWCDKNCVGKWVRVCNPIYDNFYFAEEQDVTMFTLRWL